MSDYLIIGGGLIGQLTARYLSQAGAEVSILERGQFGQESSWAGGGILSPLYPWRYSRPVNELAKWSQAQYPAMASELQEDTGIDVQWTQSGLLILDHEESAEAIAWAETMGAKMQSVSGAEITDIEPAADEHAQAGLWMPEVAQVRNPRLLQALYQDLIQRGVRLRSDMEVRTLLMEGGRIRGVQCSEEKIYADNVIIACGAWSAILLEVMGESLPVVPVRGQMILLRAKPGQLQRIVLYRDHYAIPRRDGRILVGSTLEKVGFDKSTTQQAHDDLLVAARELISKLADAPLEKHWSGLRPGSPDGVPFIGPHPRLEGLYINAGHYRNGVVTGPASAKLLTDIILGQEEIIEPVPFAPVPVSI